MSFDTTALNTDRTNGACRRLENLLRRNLLYFACRHHILELVIGEVFNVLFGAHKGPNILLFQRFRTFWPNINKHHYNSIDDPRLQNTVSQALCAEVVLSLRAFCLPIKGIVHVVTTKKW